MTISSANSAPLSLVPPSTTQVGQAPQKCDDAPQKFIGGGGDAGAGAASIGGGPATQQALIDTLRQALAVLTELVAQLQPGSAVGGASGGGSVDQAPQKFPGQVPMKTEVGAASGPGQFPGQSPMQSPMQSPTQSPLQKGVEGGGPQGDVTLTESKEAVTLRSGNGDSVKVWGDPHVEATIGGVTEKFDIGYGPGAISLRDGTRITWDTSGKKNVLDDFAIDRPGDLAGDIAVNTHDGNNVSDKLTGLTADQLHEFLDALRQYKGDFKKPLALGGGGPSAAGGGGFAPHKHH